jgi:hypothetical protein
MIKSCSKSNDCLRIQWSQSGERQYIVCLIW